MTSEFLNPTRNRWLGLVVSLLPAGGRALGTGVQVNRYGIRDRRPWGRGTPSNRGPAAAAPRW